MDRKLHNSVTALVASSALLVLGLIAGTPAPDALQGTSPALAAATPAAIDAPVQGSAPAPAAVPARALPRRSRQSVAMPFFSFAPRG